MALEYIVINVSQGVQSRLSKKKKIQMVFITSSLKTEQNQWVVSAKINLKMSATFLWCMTSHERLIAR